MLHFNELRIADKHLIIDVEVDNDESLNEGYISEIQIKSHKNNEPVTVYESPEENPPARIRITLDKNLQDIPATINPRDAKGMTTEDLLYVTAIIGGVDESSSPCGCDYSQITGVAVDMLPFYNQAMQYIKELANTCEVPKNFIDFILRFKGLEVSLQTNNCTQANELFSKYFNREIKNFNTGGCGCGRNT